MYELQKLHLGWLPPTAKKGMRRDCDSLCLMVAMHFWSLSDGCGTVSLKLFELAFSEWSC